MRIAELFENTGEASVNLKITGVLSHLVSRLDDTDADSKMSVDSLLRKLTSVGVGLSRDELMDKYDEPPFSKFIANIEGDDVVFLGQPGDDSDATAPDQSTGTLEKMAKRASSKRD